MNENIIEPLICKVYTLVAMRNSGKTTFGKKLMHLQPNKGIFVDTYDHPSYREYPHFPVEIKRIKDLKNGKEIIRDETQTEAVTRTIKKWKKGIYRLYEGSTQDNLQALFDTCYDTCIIMEDAFKIFDDKLPARLRQGFIDSRNRGVDLVLMFHAFADIPEFIAKQTNEFIIFQTEDDLTSNYKKFGVTWAKLKEAQQHVRDGVKKGKPRWYNVTVTKQ